MDKNLNVRVVCFPASEYDKEYLDTLKDEKLSESACAEGDSLIFGSLKEFQDFINGSSNLESDVNETYIDVVGDYWIYFLTDLA